MTITLAKGQPISLSKSAPSLDVLHLGLGWDPVKKKKGLFGMFSGGDDIDLDASVIVVSKDKRVIDFIYFGRLISSENAIRHGGDNLTGQGDGDDEVIKVDLRKLTSEAEHLFVTINSFRGQTFNEVENAFCRLVDDKSGKEICRYDLHEKGAHTGFVMAVISRNGGDWQVKALGAAANGRTAQDLVGPALNLI